MENVLTAKSVSVSFAGAEAVRDVSFSLAKGEIAAIIGPNGSGKSTFLKAVLGLIPYTGEIEVFGKPVREVLSRIGYVPQRFHFDRGFPLTVGEFLSLSPAKNRAVDPDLALDEVGMLSFKQSVLGKLSGGQLQRVLIANAILHDPDLLILDEPTSGIDVDGVEDFYSLIQHVNESHDTTVLLISHEIYEVQKFAGKVLCLNRDLICEGDPRTVLTKDVLRKLYGGASHDHA